MMKAAIYCRISDDRSGERLGVERQEEECRALVDRRGWEVAEVYTDNDTSAYSGAPRPEYERLLADVEAAKVGAVVAFHNDRLHRSTKELERFIDVVERTGIEVATTSGGTYDLTTSDGRLSARIVGAVARAESERKSERIRAERRQRTKRGLPNGGTRGFGFVYQEKNLAVHEQEADLIREAAAAVVSGTASWRSVAKAWNGAGVTTPRGKKWTTTSVRIALTKASLAGLCGRAGEVVGEATWPAIIDRETHERLTARVRSAPPGRPPVHLLSNIARCEACDNGMTSAQQQGRRRVYKCRQSPGESNGCGRSITGDGLDEYVTEAVLARLSGPALSDFLASLDGTGEDDLAGLQQELQDAQEALENLAREWASRLGMEQFEFFAAREVLRERRDDARTRLDRAVAGAVTFRLPSSSDGLRSMWETEAVAVRRQIMGAVLEQVTVWTVRRNGPREFDPGRVELVWRF